MKHTKDVEVTEGFRYCINCKDEFLDTQGNWKRRNKKTQTGKCSACYNDFMKDRYKDPKHRAAKLKSNNAYAKRMREL